MNESIMSQSSPAPHGADTDAEPSVPIRAIPGGFIVDTGTAAGCRIMADIMAIDPVERAKWANPWVPPSFDEIDAEFASHTAKRAEIAAKLGRRAA